MVDWDAGEREKKEGASRDVSNRVSYRSRLALSSVIMQQMGWSERMSEGDRVPSSSSRVACGLGGRGKGGRCVPAERREQASVGARASWNSCMGVGWDLLLLLFFIYSGCVACAWH